MKSIATIAIVILISTSFAHGLLKPEQSPVKISPEEAEQIIVAFLKGFDIQRYANASEQCTESADISFIHLAAGIENYKNDKPYEGTLNVSDALGSLGPLARKCYNSISSLVMNYQSYVGQFNDYSEWIQYVGYNVAENMRTLKTLVSELMVVYFGSGDLVKCAELLGEITRHSLIRRDDAEPYMVKSLEYTETDPLEEAPFNLYLWQAVESFYFLVQKSQIAKGDHLKKCENNFLNMGKMNQDAQELFNSGDTLNGVFTVLDSFIFLHPIVENGYETGLEAQTNVDKVKAKIEENPNFITDNLVKNLFWVISDVAGAASQIYYFDFIHMSQDVGDLVFRIVFDNTE